MLVPVPVPVVWVFVQTALEGAGCWRPHPFSRRQAVGVGVSTGAGALVDSRRSSEQVICLAYLHCIGSSSKVPRAKGLLIKGSADRGSSALATLQLPSCERREQHWQHCAFVFVHVHGIHADAAPSSCFLRD